jgi:hypothetical protein
MFKFLCCGTSKKENEEFDEPEFQLLLLGYYLLYRFIYNNFLIYFLTQALMNQASQISLKN